MKIRLSENDKRKGIEDLDKIREMGICEMSVVELGCFCVACGGRLGLGEGKDGVLTNES